MSKGWTTLGELPPGSLFETEGGVQAVKSEYHYPNGGCECVLLASGEYAHLNQEPGDPPHHNGALVRPLPAPGEPPTPLTEEEVRAARAELAVIMAAIRNVSTPPHGLVNGAARLLWLLGLSPGERAFVAALADDPADGVTLKVFADWLRDENREAEAKDLQEGWKERLIGLVCDFGDVWRAIGERRAQQRHLDAADLAGDSDLVLAKIRRLIGPEGSDG